MKEKLFYSGLEGVRSYRIPSLVYTKKGTLIAAVDARIEEGCDNPNRIDKVIRRSRDNGRTWESPIKALEMRGNGLKGSAAIDPCMLYDEELERIIIMYCYSPAGIGLQNANYGTGYNSEGKKLLLDEGDNFYYINENIIYTEKNEKTGYGVTEEGNIFKGEEQVGNIQLSDSIFREFPTCYLQYIYSDDEGRTWSKPEDITFQVKQPWMKFIGPGPGVGLVKKRKPAAGNYIFPVYYSNCYGLLSSAVIYSEDKGIHWKMGESPNDTRCQRKSRHAFLRELSLQEMQVVELSDGQLRAFIRNTGPEKVIYTSDSSDSGISWSAPKACDYLPNPVCMVSAVSLKENADHILIGNPMDHEKRINGTLILSEDGGETPAGSCLITDGGFAYSSLVQMDRDTLGILYEVDNGTPIVEEIRFRTVSLSKDIIKNFL